MWNHVQVLRTFFALSQNIFRVPIVEEVWRFGAMKTKAYVIYVTVKWAKTIKNLLVWIGVNTRINVER
jgi:hypothetical protein